MPAGRNAVNVGIRCLLLLDVNVQTSINTVPHKRLLGKLSFYGIKGPILRWIEAFLVDRIQSVVVEGCRSPLGRVQSGVPQGTVLGPLLFLLHINDLPSVVNSTICLCADDCLIYRPICSREDRISYKETWILLSGGVIFGA